MSSETNRYVKKCILVAAILFALRLFAIPELIESLEVESAYDILGCIGEAIGVSGVFMLLYERVLWRINPLETTPRISGKYEGEIEYQYKGGGRKKVDAAVKQSLLSVRVLISTDEISSRSISSTILNDGSECILIYSFITHPKSSVSKKNPIAYGTCRMSLEKRGELKGSYWTNQSTIGDIILVRKKK